MDLVWAIQSNLVNSADVDKLTRACQAAGVCSQLFRTIPFSDQLPDVATDRPALFYGSTGCMAAIQRSQKWRPGVFFDVQNFSFSGWGKAWGNAVLNAEAEETTLEQLARRDYPPERTFFLRPCDDSKAFAGEVLNFGEIQTWCLSLQEEECLLKPDSPIVVAEPVGIADEWRLFLVDGRLSTGSHYRSHHRLDVFPGVPEEVGDFAQGLAALWRPSPVFVMDVARSGGTLYVIEVNCFNSSGFYASDVGRLVADVSRFVEKAGQFT